MKQEKIAYYILLICILLTIVREAVAATYLLKYFNIFVLIAISSFYFIYSLRTILNSNIKIVQIELGSGIINVLTSAILAVFQSVQTDELLTILKLLVILNAIFSFYLIIRYMEKVYSIRHFIISGLLMGVGIFYQVIG